MEPQHYFFQKQAFGRGSPLKKEFYLGGQPIRFPLNTLDNKEKLSDMISYIENWAILKFKYLSL